MNIFFHSTRANKYSINALSYILEEYDDIKVFFFSELSEIEHIPDKNEINIFIFSFMTPFFEREARVSLKLKKLYPFIITCAGGPHVTEKNSKTLLDYFDYIFIGEGEIIFKKFIDNIINGNNQERIIKNFSLIDINKYQSISEKYKRFGAIEITRGCPYRCFYCQNPFNMGNIQRHKKVENIIKEIEILLRNNFRDIRFVTPDLAAYGSLNGKDINIKEFKKLIEETNKVVEGKGRVFFGSFPSEIRPEHVTEDIAEILKGKTSSKRIIIGAQSGSDAVLKKINRQHSVNDVIKAAEILYKYGFNVDVDFIFGFPFETERDLKETEKLIYLLTDKYKARIHLHYFMPLPNTPFEKLKPKPLDKNLRNFLSGLTSKKLAFGQWENQVKIFSKSKFSSN